MRSRTELMLTLVALAAAAVPARGGNLIGNGGFETPVAPAGGFAELFAGSTAMAPWQITSGSVETIDQGYWPAYQGKQSLDLNGLDPGTIQQSFATTPGHSYTLRFVYANNADNPSLTPTATMSVFGRGGHTLLGQALSHTGSTRADMDYTPFGGRFVADSTTTTLQFAATISGAQGIVLDAVAVKPVPEPSTLVLAGLGALTLAGSTWRRRRAHA